MKTYKKIEFYLLLILGITFTILIFKNALLYAMIPIYLFLSIAIRDICIDVKLDSDNKDRAIAWTVFNNILGILLTIYIFILGEPVMGIVLIIFILVATYQNIVILKNAYKTGNTQ